MKNNFLKSEQRSDPLLAFFNSWSAIGKVLAPISWRSAVTVSLTLKTIKAAS